jgi:hypothetical protein
MIRWLSGCAFAVHSNRRLVTKEHACYGSKEETGGDAAVL